MAEKVNLVSLGDSIATGTLTPFSNILSYLFYLEKHFRESGYLPHVYQLAHDGDTSGDLLWKLRNSHRFHQVIGKADFITISIGGNDLLKASNIPGFTQINIHAANHRTKKFTENWPLIIDRILSINGGVQIVVLNLYNPYNHTRYDKKLCEVTDEFLGRMNGEIAACADGCYRIADTYSLFKQYAEGHMRKMSCLYPADSLLRNPHPTPRAQRMIADLIFQQFDCGGLQDR